MHKKINEMPKEWPIARKGRKYIAVSKQGGEKSISVLYALRDVLKVTKTAREVNKVCLAKEVKVSGKVRRNINFPIQVRDTLEVEKLGKIYKLVQENKRFKFEEIKGKDSKTKIVKVIGKRLLANKKVQANLQDGRNFLFEEKFSCGDSFVIDLDKDKVVKVLPLKKDSKVEIIGGRHIGKEGKVMSIKEEGNIVSYEVKLEDGEKVFLDGKTLLVVE